ncbi:tRNA (adenosine(37)-N6)-threonylcarbamoyltransferase complex transferase subunit TsaD [Candidatus Peribacteria bacterium]|nr:tRNA (adenosine(37)-N6)-threonylcarbamoyltransferase complex transferase subunit TsaD [Candidatus Peribacteria bacterium]
MIVLGIETSCDETSVAVVKDGRKILANAVTSSIEDHAKYGGIFPEIAARRQVEYMIPVIDKALSDSGISIDQIDLIAVTDQPGLQTSLLVGIMTAETLSSVWKKKLMKVHHTMGHLSSPWLTTSEDEVKFPVLSLSVSGGHSELWLRQSHKDGEIISRTLDDAAGEAFDKGAVLLGLPYPGGPEISKLALGGNPYYADFCSKGSNFAVHSTDFSFSGMKTSLKYYLRDKGGLDELSSEEKKDIAASYQHAICSQLVSRVKKALENHSDISEVHIVGGVACNSYLRDMMKKACGDKTLRIPEPKYCTDNGAMIASAAYFLESCKHRQ